MFVYHDSRGGCGGGIRVDGCPVDDSPARAVALPILQSGEVAVRPLRCRVLLGFIGISPMQLVHQFACVQPEKDSSLSYYSFTACICISYHRVSAVSVQQKQGGVGRSLSLKK